MVAKAAAVDVSSPKSASEPDVVYGDEVMMSGLQGKALQGRKEWPTKQEVFDAIPEHLLKRDTTKSMLYAASSLAIAGLCVAAGTYIPVSWAWAPVWLLYGAVTGADWTWTFHVSNGIVPCRPSRLAQVTTAVAFLHTCFSLAALFSATCESDSGHGCRYCCHWYVGCCSRVWPPCLLGRHPPPEHSRLHLPHSPACPVLFVAAVTCRAPCSHQPSV